MYIKIIFDNFSETIILLIKMFCQKSSKIYWIRVQKTPILELACYILNKSLYDVLINEIKIHCLNINETSKFAIVNFLKEQKDTQNA